MEMLAEDSTEAESVVPGGSQEAVDAVEVRMCNISLLVLLFTEAKC